MGFLCSFRGEHYTYWINHFTFDVGGGGGAGVVVNFVLLRIDEVCLAYAYTSIELEAIHVTQALLSLQAVTSCVKSMQCYSVRLQKEMKNSA